MEGGGREGVPFLQRLALLRALLQLGPQRLNRNLRGGLGGGHRRAVRVHFPGRGGLGVARVAHAVDCADDGGAVAWVLIRRRRGSVSVRCGKRAGQAGRGAQGGGIWAGPHRRGGRRSSQGRGPRARRLRSRAGAPRRPRRSRARGAPRTPTGGRPLRRRPRRRCTPRRLRRPEPRESLLLQPHPSTVGSGRSPGRTRTPPAPARIARPLPLLRGRAPVIGCGPGIFRSVLCTSGRDEHSIRGGITRTTEARVTSDASSTARSVCSDMSFAC